MLATSFIMRCRHKAIDRSNNLRFRLSFQMFFMLSLAWAATINATAAAHFYTDSSIFAESCNHLDAVACCA